MSENIELNKAPHLAAVRTSETGCNDLFAALVAAQSTIGAAIADKENTYHNSKYADLAAVFEALRPSFAENGLGVMQFPFTRSDTVERSFREPVQVGNKTLQRPVYEVVKRNTGDPDNEYEELVAVMETVPVIYVTVRTRIIHGSGQWIEQDLEVPVTMGANPAQAVGIAITYLKRYALQAIAGIPSDDDDGNGLNGQELDAQGDYYSYQGARQQVSHARAQRRPQSPARPQGNAGKLATFCDRLRQAENLFTLRALYESSVRSLEASGTKEDLIELEKVKNQVKAELQALEPATPPADPLESSPEHHQRQPQQQPAAKSQLQTPRKASGGFDF